MQRRKLVAIAALAAAIGLPGIGGANATPRTRTLVFNGEGNRLNAYDAATFEKRTVIFSASDGPSGDKRESKDLNGQICFKQFGDGADTRTYFIAGEDTGQHGVEGDPGWGWFELKGTSFDDLHTVQRGKLVPETYSNADPAPLEGTPLEGTPAEELPIGGSNPENYGCGFLPNGNLVTTDVGDQQPQQGANGQLILWFADDERGFSEGFTYAPGAISDPSDNDYCKIDTSIATAGGVWVEGDDVYVASARPGNQEGWGIFKYTGLAGLRPEDCPDRNDPVLGIAPVLASAVATATDGVTKRLFISGSPLQMTPNAIVPTSTDDGHGWYVTSVFDGNIAEYDANGVFQRYVAGSPSGSPVSLPVGMFEEELGGDDGLTQVGTPLGIGVTPDGTIWYADIGIVPNNNNRGPNPGDRTGSVKRVRFDDDGNPGAPETIDQGLAFPDGIGVITLKLN